jgi:hypothetical protein
MNGFPRKVKIETIKALLARTGNQCAFPNCGHPIFNNDNLLIAQLCHIEAVSPDGSRFNSETTTEKVNSYDNLVFLCYRHHKETDDVDNFPTHTLRQLKLDHERKFHESNFKVADRILNEILKEINDYWTEIETINKYEHVLPEFQVEIDVSSNEQQILINIRERLQHFDYLTRLLTKDLKQEYFEILCLGIPNTMTSISTLIDQLEIKILELKLLNDPSQKDIKEELNRMKLNFKETAKRAGYMD